MKYALPLLLLLTLAAAPFEDLTFDKAKEKAKKEDKAIFIDFYTTWCVPCKEMDQTTFHDSKVQRYLAKHTVPLKVDAEANTTLADAYKIENYPTLIFIRPDGSEIGRLEGFEDSKELLHDASEILMKK